MAEGAGAHQEPDGGVSLGDAATASAKKSERSSSAGASSSLSAIDAASQRAIEACKDVKEGEPYPDLIKFPDEEKPPPEVWEIEPKYDWEREERGYIFEERIEMAGVHKDIGNEHFQKEEWDLALRRYRRAIYYCQFDEMQMHDFMDHHRETTHQIQMTSKLNLTQCILRMYEMDHEDLPEGSLHQAIDAINEVKECKPNEPKVHYRRGQVLMLQEDLPGARGALNECKRCGGGPGLREAFERLRGLEKDERERARKLYGGKIQTTAIHKAEEAILAAQDARRAKLRAVARALSLPLTAPFLLLLRLWSDALRPLGACVYAALRGKAKAE